MSENSKNHVSKLPHCTYTFLFLILEHYLAQSSNIFHAAEDDLRELPFTDGLPRCPKEKTALTYHSSDCVRAKGKIVYCRLQPPSRGRREEKPQEIRVSKVAAPLLRPARIQVSGTRVTEMLEHYFKDVIKIARRYTRLISSLEYCG